jgi:two-component system nitrogen regulation response regulator NtrX
MTATARWPRFPTARRAWSSSTSGCRAQKLDGLALLDEIKNRIPDLPVVMISGHGNIETAVSAIKRGAYDFIEKPFKADRLILIAERALETSKLKREVSELKQRSGERFELIGTSSP